jgi:hypothetical protein
MRDSLYEDPGGGKIRALLAVFVVQNVGVWIQAIARPLSGARLTATMPTAQSVYVRSCVLKVRYSARTFDIAVVRHSGEFLMNLLRASRAQHKAAGRSGCLAAMLPRLGGPSPHSRAAVGLVPPAAGQATTTAADRPPTTVTGGCSAGFS